MITPRANQRGGGNEETGTSPFTPKLSLPLLCSSLSHFFPPPPLAAAAAAALLFSFSPDLSMPKIHRMKEERRREGGKREGAKGGKGKIETKNLYLSKKNRWGEGEGQHGTFFFFFFTNNS